MSRQSNGARSRKAREREPVLAAPVPPTTEQAGARAAFLAACKDASRTRALRLAAPLESLRSVARKPTGAILQHEATRIVPDGAGDYQRVTFKSATVLTRSETTDITGCFERVVYLRGISARTFNLMIGATEQPASIYGGKRLDYRLGILSHSPSQYSEDYDARFDSRMLLRTRKGSKLAQRSASGSTIELPSRYQLEQAGIDFDCRIAREHSELIRIEQPSEPEREPNRALESTRGELKRDFLAFCQLMEARALAAACGRAPAPQIEKQPMLPASNPLPEQTLTPKRADASIEHNKPEPNIRAEISIAHEILNGSAIERALFWRRADARRTARLATRD